MTKRGGTIELLAPAGSYEALGAVTEAGCDAVYIGGSRFGARAYADNPEEELLLRGIDEAHLRGVKVYLTVNTVLKNEELSELRSYLLPYYEVGLDAVIVQDYGVMMRIAEWFPDLAIHASTQMTITHASAASILPPQVTRIVPARELSLREIAAMAKGTDLELEVFAHGALCYCYSGACLMSSLAGGRSGNRGRCAQPCRKRYRYVETMRNGAPVSEAGEDGTQGFLLSPKDQCLLPHLHELLDVGVDSLKLEGRMKKPEYAAGVTAVYRRWLDRYEELGPKAYAEYLAAHAKECADDVGLLAELYNRGGFCGGYVFDTKGRGMLCTERPNHTGVLVGKATITDQGRLAAVVKYREEIGPEEVLELRTAENTVCGEITTPKDMARFDPARPVMLRREAFSGAIPKTVDVYRTKNETLLSEIRDTFLKTRKDIPVIGTLRAVLGEPLQLTVTDAVGKACVTVTGDCPDAAQLAPVTPEQVMRSLRKTGGSGYTWEELSVDVGDNVFLPVSKLNELRREALAAYERAVLINFRKATPEWAGQYDYETLSENGMTVSLGETAEYGSADIGDCNPVSEAGDRAFAESGQTGSNRTAVAEEPGDTDNADAALDLLPEEPVEGLRCAVTVATPEQTEAVLRHRLVTDLWIDMEGMYDACLAIVGAELSYGSGREVPIGLVLPRVSKGDNHRAVVAEIDRMLADTTVRTIVVRTPDQLAEIPHWEEICGEATFYADATLYICNDTAADFLHTAGIAAGTLSPELRRSEVSRHMAENAWAVVYERSVLMVSEQCPHRTVYGCRKRGTEPFGMLTDAEGNAMPVRGVCRYCHSLIYNAHVTSLLTVLAEVMQKEPCGIRVNLTCETRRESELILRTLAAAVAGNPVAEPLAGYRYTKGHWKRGVM
ncbi:MAG: U32 family peptidase [Lachnospiraceae bacterium]|nr:U32 family peptidase [Lachnospiraceae bacterium]